MHSEEKNTDKTNSKNDSKMNLESTRKKVSDYFIFILVIAVVIQLGLLVYRLAQL